MRKYKNPTMEIQKFNGEAVITASVSGAAETEMNKWSNDGGATIKRLLFGDLEKYSD